MGNHFSELVLKHYYESQEPSSIYTPINHRVQVLKVFGEREI